MGLRRLLRGSGERYQTRTFIPRSCNASNSSFLQQSFHLPDLRFLTGDNGFAQILDSLRLNWRLLTHEDRTGVVGDHRAEELPVCDCRLVTNETEAGYSCG